MRDLLERLQRRRKSTARAGYSFKEVASLLGVTPVEVALALQGGESGPDVRRHGKRLDLDGDSMMGRALARLRRRQEA